MKLKAPKACQTCGNKIEDVFYDAATRSGQWGYMCHGCFKFGPGLNKLGPGLGQKYEKNLQGDFIKTEG